MAIRPFMLMIAGPNGSGKTTLTSTLRNLGVHFGVYINPDEIAERLSGTYEDRVKLAQVEADRLRHHCLSNGTSFSFETVMSHPSKLDVVDEANRVGFETILYFVSTVDPAINVERVKQRVALGGHSVPEDRIVTRYGRTMNALPAALRKVEKAYLFDSSDVSNPGTRPFGVVSKSEDGRHVVILPGAPDWIVSACMAVHAQ